MADQTPSGGNGNGNANLPKTTQPVRKSSAAEILAELPLVTLTFFSFLAFATWVESPRRNCPHCKEMIKQCIKLPK